MTKLARASVSGLTICLFAALVGCGGSDGPPRYEVSGHVTLGGKPLPKGTIQFVPQGPPEIPGGATIENGDYTIAADRGLPEGEYLVRISSASETAAPVEEAPGDSSGVVAKELVPPEFNVNSDKKVQVGPDKPNEFNFDIP
jgi:hypothetical protein